MRVVVRGVAMTLTDAQLLASGGEAQVFLVNKELVKVWFDPTAAPEQARLDALGGLGVGDYCALPTSSVRNEGGQIIGHTMDHIKELLPWCKLGGNPVLRGLGLGPAVRGTLVTEMARLLRELHRLSVVVTDLHSFNLLWRAPSELVFIDTCSWALPGFPATALHPAVADPLGSVGPSQDWFAFAVLAFEAFIGCHPFKGGHHSGLDLAGRMAAKLSAFDSEVHLPPAARSLDAIPVAYRDWMRNLFSSNDRSPPPLINSVAMPFVPARQGTSVTLTELGVASGVIMWAQGVNGELLLCDGVNTRLGGRRVGPSSVGYVNARAGLVVAQVCPNGLTLWEAGQRIAEVKATSFALSEGRLWLCTSGVVSEVTVHGAVGKRFLATKSAGTVHPVNTQVFEGAVLQRLLGSWYLTLLMQQMWPKVCLADLNDERVLSVVARRGLVAVLHERGAVRSRTLYRFEHNSLKKLYTEHASTLELQLTLLDNGLYILSTDDGLLLGHANHAAPKKVGSVPEDTLWVGVGDQLLAVSGDRWFAASMTGGS